MTVMLAVPLNSGTRALRRAIPPQQTVSDLKHLLIKRGSFTVGGQAKYKIFVALIKNRVIINIREKDLRHPGEAV